MKTTKQNDHEEEQRASSSCQEDQASGYQTPGMSQGFDSELGLTVEKLSTALNLPADFLKGLGVSDKKQQGIQVVAVPYLETRTGNWYAPSNCNPFMAAAALKGSS
jgi:hypothetical protein